ncbi:MAG: PAS-domain containing protein [Bauldia sp.]|nr:PAS-domain containing protein [Bauldia sp.]
MPAALASTSAHAAPLDDFFAVVGALTASDIATIAVLVGALAFAVVAALALIRLRDRTEAEAEGLRETAAALSLELERAEALLSMGGDRILIWEGSGKPPLITGTLPPVPGIPDERAGFLAFGTWLAPQSAAQLDRAIAMLRSRGETFALALTTQTGHGVDVLGRTGGGRALVRFRSLTSDRLALATLEEDHRVVMAQLEALQRILQAAPLPAWLRDGTGRLAWVNRAYAETLGSAPPVEVIREGGELFDARTREAVEAAHQKREDFRRRISTVANGIRRLFEVTDIAAGSWSGGLAIDRTSLDDAEQGIRRLVEFHARTLDQLAAGVAIFGQDQRLRSYNAAYRALFGLDSAFLDSSPTESAILDRLRATRRLPEQADFRNWKANLLSAYRATEAREQMWHLPDGQTLRVIANPHPQGGIIWIYENVSERLDLESRYNALIRVQRETLDNLSDAVAVFGSDGRLRLHNPPLATIWGLDPAALSDRPHVAKVFALCRQKHDDQAVWNQLMGAVAGLDETRASVSGRMSRADGTIVDYATVPLPDGQTMVTFVDVTDSVKVERALTERNEALEAADGLKNAFIQHVSYELRSPLTNIIGFTQLLAEEQIGPLNDKQREYAGYVLSSSDALLAIINDILDLATLDAGIMTLDLGEVDIGNAVRSTVNGVQDRVTKAGLSLDVRVPEGIGSFVADERRVRQILFNLLSNAIAFSPPGGRILISAERRPDEILFAVEDTGVGMPEAYVPAAFERFESRPSGPSRGGAGLGLPIVKSFVELHGGTVRIDSRPGEGTRVTVSLPVRPNTVAVAAE